MASRSREKLRPPVETHVKICVATVDVEGCLTRVKMRGKNFILK